MGRMDQRSVSMMIILSLLTIAVLSILPEEAGAIGAPSITIELDQTRQSVVVSPGSDGVITFTGNVTAEAPVMPPGQYLVVTLQADAGGWPVSVPPSFTFTNNNTVEPFSVSVQVPVETSHKTQGQFSISGKWRYSPGTLGGSIDPVTAIIEIEQYYSYTVSPAETVVELGVDDVTEVLFNVHNKGNSADRICLEIVNHYQLEQDGIMTSVKIDDVSVPEKQTKSIPLSVITSAATGTGNYELEVKVHSIIAEGNGADFEYVYTSCFLNVVFEVEDPDPLPGTVVPDDDPTVLPDDMEQIEGEDPEPSSLDRILTYGLGIVAALFILVVLLYLARKVRS